jgi:hypothetical protein
MSIWNKILLTLIFFASLAFFYAAARMVRTYQYWAGQTDKFEQALTDRNGQIVSLRTADHEHPLPDDSIGVLQLRIDLGRVLANRGRVWTKWEKQKAGPDPQKAGILDVTIATDESVPSAFTKNMLVYAFEEGDDQPPGKYLGEFRVVEISERQIVLASTTPLVKSDNPELKVKLLADNVLESRGPWVLYELMPTDEHEAFTNLTEDDKKWVPDDFSKDGQAGADDKRYVRTLRDYLGIFRDCETYRTLFADRMVSAERDHSYLQTAGKEADDQLDLLGKEKAQVGIEQQRAHKEQAAVASLYATLQHMFENNQAAVDAAIAKNYQSTQEIARQQKEAVDLIDRRTRSMAQNGPGAD